jgi:antitoxin component HigA of HigAB toxin-antitoxin module
MGATSRQDVARLRAQAAVLAAWEAENHPAAARPVAMFRMEQMGLGRDLVDVLGTRSRVTEVLRPTPAVAVDDPPAARSRVPAEVPRPAGAA